MHRTTTVASVICLLGVMILAVSGCRKQQPAEVPPTAPTPEATRVPEAVPDAQAAPPPAKAGSAAAPAASALPDFAFRRVHTTKPIVALTFDCCETQKPAGYDSKIVEFLISHKTPATFMLGGRWMESHPEQTKHLAAVPFFELGNHSYIHPHMTKQTREQMAEELRKTQDIQRQLTGNAGVVFRPPYGEWNDELVAVAAEQGLRTVTWDIETGDPDKNVKAEDILGAVRKAKPGAIIIMHANGRGWHSAEALPGVLKVLAARGLKPVTLSELIAAGTPEPDKSMKK